MKMAATIPRTARRKKPSPLISIPFSHRPTGHRSDPPATIFLIVMAATVLLLGPGAFSLDSRLFGRREIVIPQD
jgi:hypothetical protein